MTYQLIDKGSHANMNIQKSQMQMFYEADRKIADANEIFMEIVKDGLTREELSRLIEIRPSLWGRYKSWLDKLPSKSGPGSEGAD